ncbi:unnamed protein product [Sphenostylis stenocarpa]|uniref:Uncharacterized protein n=1 Tax=Sphenostylis stenocarpa TaxID=92480 RepID=A0AA86SCL0_9FABA|nr:unnamed protein product [Sphenostylis stenocarpa]
MADTCAMSSPFPTGRNTERTRRREPSSTTLRHRKPVEAMVLLLEWLAFLHISTAPLLLSLASLSTLEKLERLESTTMKSIPVNRSITSSASPTTISGHIPASPILSAYSNLDLSSGTTHTCLPHV